MENAYLYIGPPGTGKTSVLKGSAEKNAATFGAENVCACSYTRAAAAVISGRDFPLPAKNVGTLHSFAYRALGCPDLAKKHLSEFGKENSIYRVSPGKQSVHDPLTGEGGGTTLGDKLLKETDILRAKMIQRDKWPSRLLRFIEVWDKWKAGNGLLDFTDMLETCLRDVPVMPGNPACLIFDEAQDSSRLQLSLVTQWGRATKKLIFAADPGQAIFTFAGASPENLDEIGILPEHRHTLGQSYRLPAKIHAYAETWLERNHPTPLPDRTYLPRQDEGELHVRKPWTWDHPEPMLDQVEKWAADGKSVMILGSCGYLLNPTIAVMRKRGIPFHNPYRVEEAKWNPLRRGSGDRKISTAVDRVLAYIGTWSCDDVRLWASVIRMDGHFKRGMKEWLKTLRGEQSFPTEEFAFRCEQEFLAKLWDVSFHNEEAVKKALQLWLGAMLPANKKVLEYPCKVVMRGGKSAMEVEPRIVVGTVHSSKGAESDIVILFPDMSAAAWNEWMSGQRGPIIRTFYVGMTRAREKLFLCIPRGGMAVKW